MLSYGFAAWEKTIAPRSGAVVTPPSAVTSAASGPRATIPLAPPTGIVAAPMRSLTPLRPASVPLIPSPAPIRGVTAPQITSSPNLLFAAPKREALIQNAANRPVIPPLQIRSMFSDAPQATISSPVYATGVRNMAPVAQTFAPSSPRSVILPPAPQAPSPFFAPARQVTAESAGGSSMAVAQTQAQAAAPNREQVSVSAPRPFQAPFTPASNDVGVGRSTQNVQVAAQSSGGNVGGSVSASFPSAPSRAAAPQPMDDARVPESMQPEESKSGFPWLLVIGIGLKFLYR